MTNELTDTASDGRVLDSLPRPVLVTDGADRIVYANAALRDRLGEGDDSAGDPTAESDAVEEMPSPVGDAVDAVLVGYDGSSTGDQFVRLPDDSVVSVTSERLDGDDTEGRTVVLLDPQSGSRTGDGPTEESGVFERLAPDSDGRALPDTSETTADPFERIFEYSNDAIFVIDPEADRITRVNRRASELLGYDHAELLSLRPAEIHPHDYEEFQSFVEEVYEDGASWTTELSCYTCDDEVIPAEISGTVVEIDGRRKLLASVRDISTRIDQQRELHRLSRAVEATTDGVALFDRDGTVSYANRAFAEALGFEDTDAVVGVRWHELYDDGNRFEMDVLPSTESSEAWSDTVSITVDGVERVHSLSVTGFEDDLLVVSRDVTDERRHRRRLRGLTEASRAFVGTEDRDAVASAALDVIRDTLGFETACLRLYDERENSLERAAVSPSAEELLASAVAYDLEASRAGQAYRTGESVVNNPTDDAYAGERAHLHVPVGEEGVVTVLSDEPFSETDVQLLELFAETLRTAFARASRLQELRARQTELERRGEELTTANEFGDLVADVVRSVLGTSTREATERTVCDRLVGADTFDAAWLVSEDDGERTVRASAAADAEKLVETDTTAFVHTPFVSQLLSEAHRTGDLTVRRRRFESEGSANDGTEDLTTAAAVPVSSGEQSFGTLLVASASGDSFRGLVRNGLELLAETLCFALIADRARLVLVSNEVVEVELSLRNTLADLSAAHDCRCVLRETTPTGGGQFAHIVDVTGASVERVTEFFERTDSSPRQSPSVVEGGADSCVVRVVADRALPELLVDAGGNVRSVVAEDGETRVTVELPRGTEIDPILSCLSGPYDDVRLRAKRQRSRIDPSHALDSAAETLTERQREVVCAARDAGYYEWPRENTAEEVADSLDIAGSTFHQHLRTAERKLAEQLCGDESDTGGRRDN